MKRLHSNAEIADIAILKKAGKTWEQITRSINTKYSKDYTADSIRSAWRRWGDLYETGDDAVQVQLYRSVARTKRRASFLAKENKALHENHINFEDILEQLVSRLNKRRLPKLKEAKKASKITVEAMVSDIHVGLKTPTYDYNVLRERMRKYATALIATVKMEDAEELVLLLNGDIIQSATMHSDSPASCDMTNSEQIVAAVEVLEEFISLLLPVVPLRVKCVGGNHDRTSKDRVIVKEGRTYVTWVIYKMLEKLFPAVDFEVAEDFYCIYSIYGRNYLVEHGHHMKKPSSAYLSQHKAKRAEQYNVELAGVRHGHYHYATVWGVGEHISNGTVGSDDYFSATLGYGNPPTQVYSVHSPGGWEYSEIVRLD